LHRAHVPRWDPGDLDPGRPRCAARWRQRATGRPADRGARLRRDEAPRRRARARAGDRLRREAPMTEEEVRVAATEALDDLPAWVREKLGDVVVIVEESHPAGIMGIYDPVGGLKRIVIFRNANPNAEEVRKTV